MTLPVSKRLVFRSYAPADRESFLRLVTDETVMKHVDKGVLELPEAEQLWRKLIDEFYPSGSDTIYAVFTKQGNRYVGHAAIRPRPERKQDWEISYMLVPTAWGKGYATEIARSLIDFGFNELQQREVFATIAPENTASIAVVKKAGMSLCDAEVGDSDPTLVFSIQSKV